MGESKHGAGAARAEALVGKQRAPVGKCETPICPNFSEKEETQGL